MKIIAGIALAMTTFCGDYGNVMTVNFDEVKIGFEMPIEGVKGTVGGFSAGINFDAEDLAASSIFGSVDVKTLSTGNEGRDNHLKNDDFFSSDTYPTMSFSSSSIEGDGDGFKMKGKLQIEDKVVEEVIKFSYKDKVFSGKSTIFLTDYAVGKFSKGSVEDSRVDISFSVPIL